MQWYVTLRSRYDLLRQSGTGSLNMMGHVMFGSVLPVKFRMNKFRWQCHVTLLLGSQCSFGLVWFDWARYLVRVLFCFGSRVPCCIAWSAWGRFRSGSRVGPVMLRWGDVVGSALVKSGWVMPVPFGRIGFLCGESGCVKPCPGSHAQCESLRWVVGVMF